jgi:hypothetical protein
MSPLMGTATTSISGTLDRKMNASPECIANRGALFLCHSSPLSAPDPLRGPVLGLAGLGRESTRSSHGVGRVGPVWANLRITGFGAGLARSKSKQEKGGGVAMLPTSGSRCPATPVVSREYGLSGLQNKIGLLSPQFPENRVVSPINGCIMAKNSGVAN